MRLFRKFPVNNSRKNRPSQSMLRSVLVLERGELMQVKSKVSFALLTGCLLLAVIALFFYNRTPKARPDVPPQQTVKIAVVDMNKALKSHPKYQEGAALQKQLATLLAAQQARSTQLPVTESPAVVPMDKTMAQNIREQQLYQEKMSDRQAQVKADFNAKYADLRKQASDEYDDYNTQLDNEYQHPMFDLQLKLKTLQLSKDESDVLQGKLDKLRKEKADKLAARHQQLSAGLAAAMAVQQQNSTAAMTSFEQQVTAELHNSAADQLPVTAAAGLALPEQVNEAPPDLSPEAVAAIDRLKAQLAALEAVMVQDIENQCGKIAQQQGYEIVVTNVTTNVAADDITAQVIAQLRR